MNRNLAHCILGRPSLLLWSQPLPSACNHVFRTNFLKENTIAILPPHGYHPKIKQSNMGLKWLSFIAEKHGIYIRHKRNGGEKSVGSYYLDGYHEEINTAYEFHGCFWRGKFCLNSYLPQIKATKTKLFWNFPFAFLQGA